ncbi:MAG: hypothetical protein QOJ48_1595 [Frankiales bacterium]|nr:hypothetical protein [Frankiales bacterium]
MGVRRCLVLGLLFASGCASHTAVAHGPGRTVAPTTVKPSPAKSRPAFALTAVTGPLKFTSADGNLGCDIESAYARCDPAHRNWPVPGQPSDCASGWGHGIELQAGTKASFFCGSDSVAGGKRVLAAGRGFTDGFIECDAISATTVHCHGTTDTHGFTISRATYSLR